MTEFLHPPIVWEALRKEYRMSFPSNLDQLQVVVAGIRTQASYASKLSYYMQQQSENFFNTAGILASLADSWKTADPGKNGGAYFFLDATQSKRVVVKEFLPLDTEICIDDDAWRAYTATKKWHGQDHDRVPHWFSVIPLSRVAKGPCSACKEDQPLIESYCQTYDSPEGDVWEKNSFVFCCDCTLLTKVATKVSDNRIF